MKWLDILAAWSTYLEEAGENAIDEVIKHGQFLPEQQSIAVESGALTELAGSLLSLGAPIALLQLSNGILREHTLSKKPFYMRVEPDSVNYAWQRQCEFLFSKRALLNWRSLLCVKDSRIALEYVGQSWSTMQPLGKCDPSPKELSIIVFQLLWTFAVLARCQIFLPVEDWAVFFGKVFVQRNRVDYFGDRANSEFVFFMRGNTLKETFGVYRVPVRNAFVHISFEPTFAMAFGHESYSIADRIVSVEHMCYNENYTRSRCTTESLYFGNFALQLRNFLFPNVDPIHNGLSNIVESQDSVEAFLNGPLANEFWMDLKPQDRANILRVLVAERTVSVLFLPKPDEMRPVHQRNFRSDWLGFPNLENNCFLNSVLFMLMCPNRLLNAFADTIDAYADMPQPTNEESELIRTLQGAIVDPKQLENMRRILARLFSSALQKAFSLSNYGTMADLDLIEKQCSNLLPLLDLWSMAARGQFFARVVGEYQDLDECLRLLYSLLLFESCCTSTIAITEEFPNLSFDDGEKLSHDEMEQLSHKERNNPLCLRVASTLESPIIRFDWSTLGTDQNGVIDLQSMCATPQFECSIVPSPLSATEKETEKRTKVKISRCTRFNLKRVMRSRGCKMAIIHIFRQNVTFVGDRMVYTVKKNSVVFPANEILSIDGNHMKIQSLALWSNSHYTCLIYCYKTLRWWHVNDLLPAGRRFQDFGATLAEAMALINRFCFIITTITCVSTEENRAERDIEQQCFVELPKLCCSSDTMRSKAILFHKDDNRLKSARSTLLLISEPVFDLPSNFLFGHDDPNDDFIFRREWFSDRPLAAQRSGIVLVIASGLTPTIEHSLDLPLDHIQNIEMAVGQMTSITMQATVTKARERAQRNLETIKSLQPGEQITTKNFSNILTAFNARLARLTGKKFIDAAGENNALFDCNTTSWVIDLTVTTAIFNGSSNATAGNMLRRKRDYRLGPYFSLQKIVMPFYLPNNSGFVVLIEPQKRLVSVFDPFNHCNSATALRIVSFLVYLQRKFFGEPNASDSDWKVVTVLMLNLFSRADVAFSLLFICGEIISNRENLLLLNSVGREQREKASTSYAKLFGQVGELKL